MDSWLPLIRLHMERSLDALEADSTAERKLAGGMQVEGYRLVDGGQVDGDRWEITDATTGETLAAGDSGLTGMDEAWRDDWYHVDRLVDQSGLTSPEPTDGLPGSLQQTIDAWVCDHPDEARALLGRPSLDAR